MGVVPYAFLAVSLVGALFVVNAWFPVRREPLSVLSFAAGWPTSELAYQHIVWQALATAAFAVGGALRGWAGWAGLAVAVASWLGLAGLHRTARQAGPLVARSLAEAHGGPFPGLPDPPSPRWCRWWRELRALPFNGPEIKRVKGIDYAGDGDPRHRLDVVVGRDGPRAGAPVLVQIHGGAWIVGDKREQGIPLMNELAARGWVCVAINYRLSPKATWPDHVVDCKRAVAWVKEHIAEYGGDPSFVAVTGGSAGGHLSALLALTPNDKSWQPGFEGSDTSVQACVAYYGVYDMTGKAGSGRYGPGLVRMLERLVMKQKLADNIELFKSASPTLRVRPDAPAFLVFHGTNDTLVPLDVARQFVAALRGVSSRPVAYVELPRAQHAFDILVSPRCWAATAGAVAFLETLAQRSGSGRAQSEEASSASDTSTPAG